MTTYTKETALYDTNAIGDDIAEAGQANSYVTSVGTNGVFVHTKNSPTPTTPLTTGNYGVNVGSDVDIVNNGVSVANYGSTARIGKTSASNIRTSSDSIKFYNQDYEIGSISMRGAMSSPKYWTTDYMSISSNPVDMSSVQFDFNQHLIEFSLIDAAIGGAWSTAYIIVLLNDVIDSNHVGIYLLIKTSDLTALMPSGATISQCKLYVKEDGLDISDPSTIEVGVNRNGTYLMTTTAPIDALVSAWENNMAINANVVVDDFECDTINSISPADFSRKGHTHSASDINNGTLAVANGGTGAATASANRVFAAPNGSAGAPSFRSLVAADIPSLAASKTTSGVFAKERLTTTSWTYAAGSDGATFYVRWCKVAHIVHVEVYGSKSITASTATTLSTTAITSGNRPTKEVDNMLYSSQNHVGALWVDTSGNVKCKIFNAASNVYGFLSYPVI